MFTGLVQDVGRVTDVRHAQRASRLTITTSLDLEDATLGESIAINGACLTVVELSEQRFSVDVSPESLDKTTLGALAPDDRVHLERALRLADRLGGHLVLGHVDGVGKLSARRREANAWHLSFESPRAVSAYLVPKGCITVDGVSLTVNRCDAVGFDVTIVPHTAERTLLARLPVGAPVNLEADIVGKYVAGLLGGEQTGSSRLSELLAERGFMGSATGPDAGSES